MKMRGIVVLLLLTVVNALAFDADRARSLIDQAKSVSGRNPLQGAYYAQQALNEIGDEKSALRVRALIAYSYAQRLQGNFDVALKSLFEAQQEVPHDSVGITAEVLYSLGRLYSKLGDNNRAIDYMDRATSMYKSLGDSAGVAECYNGRGLIHYETGDNRTADIFFERSMDMNRKLRNIDKMASNINNFCLYKGDTDKKISMIQEAIVINRNLGNNWALGENYNNLGKQLYYADRYGEALDALAQARSYADEVASKELVVDYYEYASMVHAAVKNYRKAYLYLDSMRRLRDEMQGGVKLRNIEQSIAEHQMMKQRYEADRQEQDYRIGILMRNIWLLLAVIVILAVTGVSAARKRSHEKAMQEALSREQLQQYKQEVTALKLNEQQQQLAAMQAALDQSHAEVTNFAMFLHSRKELRARLRELVKEGYKLSGDDLKAHLKKIGAFLNQYENNDSTTMQMMSSIEAQHNAFLERLSERHPHLTRGERSLATLIRINMPAKEIALLTNTTPKTVNMNRYRLRKSLGLDADTDLNAYLAAL